MTDCGINFKGTTYTKEEFIELLQDPIVAEEIRVNVVTDKFLDIYQGENKGVFTVTETLSQLKEQGFLKKNLSSEAIKIYSNIALRGINNSNIVSSSKFGSSILSWVNNKLGKGPLKTASPITYEAYIKSQNNIRVNLRNAEKLANDLNKYIEKLGKKITPKDKLSITDILQGMPLDTLTLDNVADPAQKEEIRNKIFDIASKMRTHIDNLSNNLIDGGYLSEAGVELFQNNLGKYVTRVYETHINPEMWWHKLRNDKDPEMRRIFTKGQKYIKDSLIRRRERINGLIEMAAAEIRKNAVEPSNLYELLVDAGDINPELLTKKAFKNLPAEERQQMFQDSRKVKKFIEKRNDDLFKRRDSLTKELKRLNDILQSEDSLVNYIQQIVGTPEGGKPLVAGERSMVRSDMSIFKKRGEIPEEIRGIMGEIRDPAAAYAASIKKMVEFQSKYDFQLTFALFGENVLFSRVPVGDFDVAFNISNLPGMRDVIEAKDNIIYVNKFLAEDFKGNISNSNFWVEAVSTLNIIAKWGVTVGNPITQLRNFSSAFTFLLFNGNLINPSFIRSFSIILSEIKNLAVEGATKKNIRSPFLNTLEESALRNGVLNSSVDIGEVSDLLKKSGLFKRIENATQNNGVIGLSLKGVSNFIQTLNSVYQASDNLIKLASYYAELERNAAVFGNYKGYNDILQKANSGDIGAQEDLKRLEFEAGKIVRNTVPNYSESWRINDLFRKNIPIMGVFTTFTTEMLRTQYNAIKLTWDTLERASQETDPQKKAALAKIGLQRMLGLTAMYSITFFQESLREVLDWEDEEEKYTTLDERNVFVKYWAPPWVKQVDLRRDPDIEGGFIYSDPGNLNPYSLLNNFHLHKRISSDSALVAFAEYLNPIIAPFVTPELGSAQLVQILQGKDKNGNAITNYNVLENPKEFSQDILLYFVKESLFVPGFTKELVRYVDKESKMRSLQDKLDRMDYKERKSAEKEIKEHQENMANSLEAYLHFGYKDNYMSINRAAGFKMRDLEKELSENKQRYSKMVKNNPDNYQEYYEDANKVYQKELTKMREMVIETRDVLGVDIKEDLKDANSKLSRRLNREAIGYILGYISTPPDISIRDYEQRER